MANGRFNIPIVGSVVDVMFMVVCVFATAWLWFNSKGVDKITEARQEVVVTAERVKATIDDKKAEIVAKREDIAREEARRDSLNALNEHVTRVVIPREIQGISDAQEKSQQLTTEFLTLRGRLGNQRDKLRDTQLHVEQLTETANRKAGEEGALRDTVFASYTARQDLAIDVEEMQAYRERDPWSMFPVSASLSAYAEVGEDANFLTFSLSKDIYRTGRFDIGIQGALGFGNEQGTSIKEAGLYANYELWFRKASLDIGAGWSNVSIGTDSDATDPYASLMLRFAPYYRERVFLLLGTKYSHESLSYLVGIGFGRR